MTQPVIDARQLDPARDVLKKLVTHYKGLLLEDKGSALALHFRQAPQHERAVMVVMAEIADHLREKFVLRDGKCVLELTPRGYSKRASIEAFMREAAVRRTARRYSSATTSPTKKASKLSNALGGYSVRVGDLAATAAKFRFSNVSTVISWLRERNLNRPAKPQVGRKRSRDW